jgi:hypothetical protein
MDPVYGYQAVNVEAQLRDPSLVPALAAAHARRCGASTRVRHRHLRGAHAENPSVLAYLRQRRRRRHRAVRQQPQPLRPAGELHARQQFAGKVPIELTRPGAVPPIGELPYFVTLAAVRLLLVPAATRRRSDHRSLISADDLAALLPDYLAASAGTPATASRHRRGGRVRGRARRPAGLVWALVRVADDARATSSCRAAPLSDRPRRSSRARAAGSSATSTARTARCSLRRARRSRPGPRCSRSSPRTRRSGACGRWRRAVEHVGRVRRPAHPEGLPARPRRPEPRRRGDVDALAAWATSTSAAPVATWRRDGDRPGRRPPSSSPAAPTAGSWRSRRCATCTTPAPAGGVRRRLRPRGGPAGQITAEMHVALAEAFGSAPGRRARRLGRRCSQRTRRTDPRVDARPRRRKLVRRLRVSSTNRAVDPRPRRLPPRPGRCAPTRAGTSSTSRASRPDPRSSERAGRRRRCATSPGCCVRSTTPPRSRCASATRRPTTSCSRSLGRPGSSATGTRSSPATSGRRRRRAAAGRRAEPLAVLGAFELTRRCTRSATSAPTARRPVPLARPTLGELDLHLIGEGPTATSELWTLGESLGAHDGSGRPTTTHQGVAGTAFAVWAPNGAACGRRRLQRLGRPRHPMRSLGSSGVWELFVPGVGPGAALQVRDPRRRRRGCA